MKLYHGSPKKLKEIVPMKGKGINKFENQKAVFLCKTFHHAALYAISKTLKGRAVFAVTPRRIIIAGNKKPGSGYVYEVNVDAEKGERNQFVYKKSIADFKITKVDISDYGAKITYVKTKDELLKKLRLKNDNK
ncbi:hypothetical protein HNV12_04110 [Methanococcoides sp. SA1]|nr:hypothetical protein [Methanococcoides sp. SA1]